MQVLSLPNAIVPFLPVVNISHFGISVDIQQLTVAG